METRQRPWLIKAGAVLCSAVLTLGACGDEGERDGGNEDGDRSTVTTSDDGTDSGY